MVVDITGRALANYLMTVDDGEILKKIDVDSDKVVLTTSIGRKTIYSMSNVVK